MNTATEFPSWAGAPPLAFDHDAEQERVAALHSLHLLDTEPESRFDRITRLAAEFFKVPISYVAFLDHNRQWVKSRFGICHVETSRGMTFCQYTLALDDVLIIPNATEHPIGLAHPMVMGAPYVRFYAGVPLSGPKGKKIGTFCIVDLKPREFGSDQVTALRAFASLVEREVNLGEIIENQQELLRIREKLIATQKNLEHELADAARYVRRMLPQPLEGLERIDWQFHPSATLGGDGLGYRRIDEDKIAFYVLDVTGHGLGSALLAVTAMELLRNPVAVADFAKPSAIIQRLNRTFQMKDHSGKFFSAWYGVYSRSARTVTYSNAGHPPPLLVMREGGSVRLERTEPGTSVLGIEPELVAPETTVAFPQGSEMLLFTDGLYELPDAQGGHGSYDEFLVDLQKRFEPGKSAWEVMLNWYAGARDENSLEDDVSMLRFAV